MPQINVILRNLRKSLDKPDENKMVQNQVIMGNDNSISFRYDQGKLIHIPNTEQKGNRKKDEPRVSAGFPYD